MEIWSVGVAVMHVDGRTDMTRLIGAFHDYANASKTVLNLQM